MKKRGTHTIPTRGTGIPFERNRQAHAILSYSMNIALLVPFKMKITSFRVETFSERYVISKRKLIRNSFLLRAKIII